ncbi:RNA-directed DNA polymerase from mobile element jockey [Merluccius polli]|uniref:RNA-directed DNA polymerase from mobile element jockey n=1 Tax=Merluccius polli TaxID=89951 RepID=A0AA47P0F4_MERPO|nr:RNA-directed DNA polymerase from mobile element jockey [Merluccius polli]
MTHCITDYINFCVENTVPSKLVRCFPNNKPWVTSEIKTLLNEKKRVFRLGDKEELRRVQKELRQKIRKGKDNYRRKLEKQLEQKNARDVWRGLATEKEWGEIKPAKDLGKEGPGPDGISPRLLKDCADQLCGVFRHLFNLSLSLEKVPALWKTSCVVPVPKTPRPKEPNHFRPVALTSHLMKTMERIILRHLRPLVGTQLDPLQFAYQPGIGVDDAVIYMLHRSLLHLEGSGRTVRVMFFYFSSAFNTIKPSLLKVKMENVGVDQHLAAWTTDYLTNRPQFVRLHNCVSDVVLCSTGAPQGTVLSPFLFTLYTSDFTLLEYFVIDSEKFSDDTAVVGCVSEGNELEYRTVIRDFVSWSELNQLQLNTSKTKEMIVNFRRKASHFTPVNFQGLDIEVVESYTFLGVHLNNKLDWAQFPESVVSLSGSLSSSYDHQSAPRAPGVLVARYERR